MTERSSFSGNQIIQTLDKGLQLLDIIEQSRVPLSLHELTHILGWDKASVLRQCNTLEKWGYIRKDLFSRGYTLGLKIYQLYSALIESMDLQQDIRPFLIRFSKETGETVHLSVVQRGRVVFIDKVLSEKLLSANLSIGDTEPLYCTSVGKAYLAFAQKEVRDENLLKEREKRTDFTITGLADMIKELQEIKDRGFAVDNEEYIEGMRCVGAPIFNNQKLPIAMIGLSAPSFRLSLEKAFETGNRLVAITTEASHLFGYRE